MLTETILFQISFGDNWLILIALVGSRLIAAYLK